MNEYFDFVENLAKNKEDKMFFNSGPIHASIVMSRIFEYAKDEIKIFCGGFSGAVSNDPLYLNSLERFLKRENTKLKILVENYDDHKNSKIYSVLKKYPKVQILVTSERVKNNVSNKPIHFTIGDNKMLRLETNPDDFTAQVNFNASNSEILVNLFNKMYTNNTNIEINLALK